VGRKSVFDDYQAELAANRSEFYRAVASGPFYGYNRPDAVPSEPNIDNWSRQGMMGGAPQAPAATPGSP
jgi:non-heme chloroperoxidase